MKGEKADHVTIKIPRELIERMDELKGKEGFRSRGEIAKEAIRKLLKEYGITLVESALPMLEHFNLDENGVKIVDRKIGYVVDVFFKPDGIQCEHCQTDTCPHIMFALTVPEIRAIIRKRRREGWKLPEV